LKAGSKVLNDEREMVLEVPASLTEVLTVEGASTSAVLTVKDNGELDVSGANVTFTGDVVFGGDLTLTTAGAVTFTKIATFGEGKAIKMSTATNSVVTLNQNAGLAVGEGPFPYNGVLRNTEATAATLTAGADSTKLTFSGPRTITQGSYGATESNTPHKVAIAKKVELISGATYIVASAADKVGTLTVTAATNDVLTLGAGVLEEGDGNDASRAQLVLTGADLAGNGAKLDGAGKVVAGKTEIVGGTVGTASWQAAGPGTVTISADKITASESSVSLKAVTGSAKPSITVLAGGTLTIDAGTTIALGGTAGTAVGSIVLSKAVGDPEADAGTIALPLNASITAIGGETTGTADNDQLTTALGIAATGSNAINVTANTSADNSASGVLTKLIGVEGGKIVGPSSSASSTLKIDSALVVAYHGYSSCASGALVAGK
jgi:hypothetical protein